MPAERAAGQNGDRVVEEMSWHAADAAEVADRLGTGDRGLSVAEVAARRDRFGPNQLEDEAPPSVLRVLLHQFASPLIFILLVAAVVTSLLDEWIDTWVIAGVLVLNAAIGFFQERRAEESVRALRSLVAPEARVIRDGGEQQVASRDLVPGDLVLLESGNRVPADIRLLQVVTLRVDESLLTGESIPEEKTVDPVPESSPVGDRSCMAYAGSIVASGRGRGVVVETGARTELGGIASLMREEVSPASPLQVRLTRLAKLIGVVVAVSAGAGYGIGVLAGELPSDMFRFAVALAVSAIPEGLPVVLTITLAVGVRRMSQRNALIRRLAAVETLGSTTVIGSDKTGTITENRMTVRRLWAARTMWSVENLPEQGSSGANGDPVFETLLAGVLASEAKLYEEDGEVRTEGDPTEAALLVAAFRNGLRPGEARRRFDVASQIPFESERRYSAVTGTIDGRRVMYVKGAPERMAELASRLSMPDGAEPLDVDEMLAAADEMAAEGLRVLAMARLDLEEGEADLEELGDDSALVLLGLQGMLDPPREGVAEAVDGCRRAGIRPLMITGDHAATALAIAVRVGIAEEGAQVVTGAELDGLSDEQLADRVAGVAVFARVSPEHKLRIVRALRGRGEVVAVTGDGVNDAPALKAADIGVAMGQAGTDVAREAADMVLADDNFASIYEAVHQGRVTFDNVRKVTFFLLSTGAAEIVALTAALSMGWPLLLLPTQILWLNLVTNGVQDVALAFEPAEPGILERPPRPVREGVISRLLWKRTVLVGLVMAVGMLLAFRWELDGTGSVESARTAALVTMVFFQAFHLGNVRSERVSAFRTPLTSNRFLLVAVVVALSIQVAALYVPFTRFILSVEPIGAWAWVRSLLLASSVLLVGEFHKAWERRKASRL